MSFVPVRLPRTDDFLALKQAIRVLSVVAKMMVVYMAMVLG